MARHGSQPDENELRERMQHLGRHLPTLPFQTGKDADIVTREDGSLGLEPTSLDQIAKIVTMLFESRVFDLDTTYPAGSQQATWQRAYRELVLSDPSDDADERSE